MPNTHDSLSSDSYSCNIVHWETVGQTSSQATTLDYIQAIKEPIQFIFLVSLLAFVVYKIVKVIAANWLRSEELSYEDSKRDTDLQEYKATLKHELRMYEAVTDRYSLDSVFDLEAFDEANPEGDQEIEGSDSEEYICDDCRTDMENGNYTPTVAE